jgi:hypothetical protein
VRKVRLILAVALALGAPATVQGSNDLGHIHGYSGSSITFYHVNLTSSMHNASNWTEANNVAPTDVSNGHVDRTSSISDGVNVHDDLYGDTGWNGLWQCLSYYSNRCLFSQIKYNLSFMPTSTDYHKALACHEEGHALGLAHSSSTNLNSCTVTIPTASKRTYTDHDDLIINSKY